MKKLCHSGFFSVHPRYTAGSGAQVNEIIARRVATQEKEAYEHTLTGVYGEEARLKAECKGLAGIAEHLTETKKGWEIEDLCTGESHLRPFNNREKTRTTERRASR